MVRCCATAAGAALASITLTQSAAAQGISVDGRLSPAQTLRGPNYAIGAELGVKKGANLFHSFGVFGLKSGESATFSGPADVNNVIGRVTGGAPSSIDGTVRSTIRGANLYLINPSGVVFGPNARVDVSGSFHASSADYLRMTDGAKFQATNPDASTLTAAPPAAFGFLSSNPRQVSVNGSELGPVTGTLGLVGGAVTISGGVLLAPGGTVHVTSVAGPGEVPVDPRTGPAPTVTSFGTARIENKSRLVVRDSEGRGGNGSVHIRAGTLDFAASEVDADNYGSGTGGLVSLHGDNAVTVRDGSIIQSVAYASGRGGDLEISAGAQGSIVVDASTIEAGSLTAAEGGRISLTGGRLAVRNGAQIFSSVVGQGAGGAIDIAAGDITLDGPGTLVVSLTNGASLTDMAGGSVTSGSGGPVHVTGTTLAVTNGAQLVTRTNGDGAGGILEVAIAGGVRVNGTAGDPDNTGSAIATVATGGGMGGNLTIRADSLFVGDQGFLVSNSYGSGAGGAMHLVIAKDILLTTAGNINTNAHDAGRGGGTMLDTATLTVTTGGSIGTYTNNRGDGGPVIINAINALLDGFDSNILSATTGVGLMDKAGGPVSAGTGGSITLTGQSLTVQNWADISTSTDGSGAGGVIALNVSGPMLITSIGGLNTASRGEREGGAIGITAGSLSVSNSGSIYSTVFDPYTSSSLNPGTSQRHGGAVDISVGSLTLSNIGSISSNASSGHIGGNITIHGDTVLIDGQRASGSAGISTKSQSHAIAGSIDVHANTITIRNNGYITSNGISNQLSDTAPAVDGGTTGSVTVTARNTLSLSGGTTERFGSRINADTYADQPGGAVTVEAGVLTISGTSIISSNTFGTGRAGSVLVTVHGPLSIDGTQVADSPRKPGINSLTRSASPDGRGGDVTVSADEITILNGLINADTFGNGDAGTVHVGTSGTLKINGILGSDWLVGISAQANNIGGAVSTGHAGDVSVSAGSILMTNQARISSATFGLGNAGKVTVTAADITLTDTSLIRSSTASPGHGRGGEVDVAAAGTLVIADTTGHDLQTGISAQTSAALAGDAGAIAVHANRLQIGRGGTITARTVGPGAAGDVLVSAGTIKVDSGGQISSTTEGTGNGGRVTVDTAADITLSGKGRQIATTASGTGNAGPITVSARQLSLRDGASISTEALGANGGNIHINVMDMVYLQDSAVTTSVNGRLGDGGNITIDPQFVILDASRIKADAFGGKGGNIYLQAGYIIQSADSAITATSQLGVSGDITFSGPLLNLNSSFVVLASSLRSAAAVLRESCATRGDAPRSTLVDVGRGGMRASAETTLPALYLAGRPVVDDPDHTPAAPQPVQQTILRLSTPCG
ncbi:MAG: filamentous hemagglutinin N-terminal domain-containing protein [Acetobacteraceae bacterium]